MGFPGETEEDFKQTLDFIADNRKYINEVTNVSSFVLMPGSDIGIYAHKFGVSFTNIDDPGSWIDKNGLTQKQRNERVVRTCNLLEELNINSLIINCQAEDDTQKQADKIKVVESIKVEDKFSVLKKKINPLENISFYRRQWFRKVLLAILLLGISIIADFYLWLIKKFRGSIIFPGS